jgi:hypothetical protein
MRWGAVTLGDEPMKTTQQLSAIGRGHSILLVILLATLAFPAHSSPADTQAKAALEKLRSLAGDWEGKDNMDMPAKTNFKVMVSGTTVMETLSPTGMGGEDMVTLYTVDGDSIRIVHYCPTNNQPRMRATPGAGEIKELTFEFQGAGNLPDESVGHQHKLVLRFEDADHITESWTWRAKGKDTPMVVHFTRKKS